MIRMIYMMTMIIAQSNHSHHTNPINHSSDSLTSPRMRLVLNFDFNDFYVLNCDFNDFFDYYDLVVGLIIVIILIL